MRNVLALRVSFAFLAVVLLAGACTGSADGDLGPTAEERNTVAVVDRFSPSTASLAVLVGGQLMTPSGVIDGSGDLQNIPQLDVPVMGSSGSAFVVELDGAQFVVTNFHVVQDTLEAGTSTMVSNSSIEATFPGQSTPVPLAVVGVNPSFDLALLEPVDPSTPLPDVLSIPIADSDRVQVGQKTIAMGNPFGLGASVTIGAVSSVGRFVESVGMVSIPMIQTDAAINPGNSGGALLNSSGELIGINTAIFNPEARSFAGIGFSVPSNLLVEALANLELGGVSNFGDTRPTFGAQLGTLALLPPEVRAEAGLPDTGVVILEVRPGGPADQAGLQTPELVNVLGIPVPANPEIIVAIDGRPVNTAEDLNLVISYDSDFGQEVTLTVLRNGSEEEVVLTLN